MAELLLSQIWAPVMVVMTINVQDLLTSTTKTSYGYHFLVSISGWKIQ